MNQARVGSTSRPTDDRRTTDGEMLIVASTASGRPLAKVPLTAVDQVAVEPAPTPPAPRSLVGRVRTGPRSDHPCGNRIEPALSEVGLRVVGLS
jgi:hypothetical protein